MSDVEERVRRGLHELATDVPVDPMAPPQVVAHVLRARRRRVAALTAGSAVIVAVLIGSIVAALSGPTAAPVIVAGPDGGSVELSDPGAARFELRDLAPSPLSPREDMTGVWTGEELIIWGGTSNGAVTGDGAAYSPATDSWRRISDGPLSARTRHMAVWTGREMIVWGGTQRTAGPGGLLDGAAYDPATDTWRTISPSPPGTDRTSAATAFAGGSALFGGGGSSTGSAAESVLVYDVATDTWAQHDVGDNVVAMTPFDGRVAIATVDTLDRTGLDIELFDPATGSTELLPAFPDLPTDAPFDSVGLAASGSALFAATTVADLGGQPTTRVAVLDPSSGEWSGLRAYSADRFEPGNRPEMAYAPGLTEWTGTWLVSWANGPAAVAPGTDRTIDRLPTSSIPCGAAGVSVWTGDELLQWGGQNCRRTGPSAQVDTGVAVRIDPPGRSSGADSTTSAPVQARPPIGDEPRDGDLRLVDLVNALGDDVEDCCRVTDEGVEFTWTGGARGSLTLEGIDPSAPADPRVGMTDPQYVTGDAGTYLADATRARFDCGADSTQRYTLSIAAGPPAPEAVAAVSAAAGCRRVAIAAPTQCLAQLSDPAVCVEPGS